MQLLLYISVCFTSYLWVLTPTKPNLNPTWILHAIFYVCLYRARARTHTHTHSLSLTQTHTLSLSPPLRQKQSFSGPQRRTADLDKPCAYPAHVQHHHTRQQRHSLKNSHLLRPTGVVTTDKHKNKGTARTSRQYFTTAPAVLHRKGQARGRERERRGGGGGGGKGGGCRGGWLWMGTIVVYVARGARAEATSLPHHGHGSGQASAVHC